MYPTIDSLVQANRAAGQHFFDASTMRFFNSRVCRKIIGNYFVTSERFDASTPRRYTIRRINDDGHVETVGEFQKFATSREAYRAIRALAEG